MRADEKSRVGENRGVEVLQGGQGRENAQRHGAGDEENGLFLQLGMQPQRQRDADGVQDRHDGLEG